MVDTLRKKTKTGKMPAVKMRGKHDEAVKDFLSENETARSFFQEYLPPEIVRNLDFNTLQICKDSFIDKKLAKYFSDILYQVNLKDTGIFIYLLIDHKSKEDWLIAFQFLKYMVRIWELYLKQNEGARTLPVIIPMVIYHGARQWQVDTHFIGMFDAPGYLKEYVPDFGYNLYDISHVPDEAIKGAVLLRIILMTLKYIFTPELSYKLRKEIFPLFHELNDKEKGTEYLEVLLRYLTCSTGSLSVEELNEAVTQLYEEGGDIMATIAEKWLEQGMEKGIQKGKLEKAFETAKKMMKKGFDLDTVLEITGLDKKQIEKLA